MIFSGQNLEYFVNSCFSKKDEQKSKDKKFYDGCFVHNKNLYGIEKYGNKIKEYETKNEYNKVKQNITHINPSHFVMRVPSSVLGHNVLGMAIPSLNLMMIRDDLYGSDEDEVDEHEDLHLNNPCLSEALVRNITKTRYPNSRYQ